MELPTPLLDKIIEYTNYIFENHTRSKHLTKQELEIIVRHLYNMDDKTITKIKWVSDVYEIRDLLKNIDKPWVYHYSLNLNWVLFFKTYYEFVSFKSFKYIKETTRTNFDVENRDVYKKVCCLYDILNNIDGVIEDGDTIYLIKDDVTLIRPTLQTWKI
jgi:hypothetical protein